MQVADEVGRDVEPTPWTLRTIQVLARQCLFMSSSHFESDMDCLARGISCHAGWE